MANELVVSDQERELMQISEEDLARAPKLEIQMVKVKQGKFVLNKDLTAKELSIVILDHSYLNTLYEGAYKEDVPSKPICYATHVYENGMAPTDDVPDKQSASCEICWAAQWESDRKGGRGKECKNQIRLVAVLLARQPDGSWDGMLLEFKLGPTSLKAFHNFRVRVESYRKRAMRSVMTRVSLDPNSNYPIYVFEPVADITDRDLELKGLASLVMRYPLGEHTAIRQHLLRGFEDAPTAKAAAGVADDQDVPF